MTALTLASLAAPRGGASVPSGGRAPPHESAAVAPASLPVRALRELTQGIPHRGPLRPISLGIGEPQAPDAGADRRRADRARSTGLSVYPATAGEPRAARGLRRLAAAPLRRARRPGDAGAAGQRLARGAVRAGADGGRRDARRRHRGVPESVLSDLRRRGAAGRRRSRTSPTATRRATSRPTGQQIDDATWARTQLLYVCSPGNPTGAVMPLAEWQHAVRAVATATAS